VIVWLLLLLLLLLPMLLRIQGARLEWQHAAAAVIDTCHDCICL